MEIKNILLLFDIVLEVLTRAIRDRNCIKWIQIKKKSNHLSADEMISYIRDTKITPQNF